MGNCFGTDTVATALAVFDPLPDLNKGDLRIRKKGDLRMTPGGSSLSAPSDITE